MMKPFYDPEKSYEDNVKEGPFGVFSDGKKYEEKKGPGFDFLGQKVNFPFGIAAGPLVNGRFIKAALDKGFDIVTYKTARTRKYPCHPWPNVLPVEIPGENLTLEKAEAGLVVKAKYEPPLSITNSFGVPSFDPDFWQEDLKSAVKSAGPGQVVIGAFQGTPDGGSVEKYIEDFKMAARLMKQAGAKILEVNLSCPNEGSAHLLCFDIERSIKVAEAIKNEVGETPLILKLAYFKDRDLLSKFVKTAGKIAQGFSTINTIGSKIVDRKGNQALPGEGRLKSGVGGAGIKWAGLEMTARLKKFRETFNQSFTIIGVGGVTKKEDFKEYRDAGADTVMSATGAMWNPYLAQEIKKNYKE